MPHNHPPGERCVMCELGDEGYAKLVKDTIERVGWAIQGVHGSQTSNPLAYSMGMTRFELPEIMLIGPFQPRFMSELINGVGYRMRADKAFDDLSVDTKILDDRPVMFRELTPEGIREICVQLPRFMGDGTRVLQLIVPDDEGRWPWEDGCEIADQLADESFYKTPHPVKPDRLH